MNRNKGRLRTKAIRRRGFDHVVEIPVPPGGLGLRLDAMHDFHTQRGLKACLGQGPRDEGRDCLRWYFATHATAVYFAFEFYGTLDSDA
jgi:hypothetical protein